MKKLLLLLLFISPVEAQVQLVPFVKGTYLDQNGRPLSNGCLFSYISGTNTPLATYTDSTGTFPQTNPVRLGADGRPLGGDIWLSGSSAYRLKLVSAGGSNCSAGFTIWTEDGIAPGSNSLLASNNVWTGTNTYNGAVTFNVQPLFNVGLNSNGPNLLNGGGTLAGTYTGSPTFSGGVNFSGGITSTTGTFSGQIISTVTTGTAPFVVASTTVVPNLNASLLLGCTWAAPCPIGSTTPNSGVFTTLVANTSLAINGSTPATGVQGTDTKLLSAGTVAGVGAQICTDANLGATTTGCPSGFTKIQSFTFCSAGCTITGTPCSTTNTANNTCNNVISWPSSFADTNYSVTCMGIGATNFPFIPYAQSKSTTQVSVVTSNGQGSAAAVSSFGEIDCTGVHP